MRPKKKEDSAARRTRSQVAPDWSLTDSLILVNEIGAVEADCRDALSYYQKWKMIADNCAALDVNRTLDQCRRKWDSLFADYNSIKRCDSSSYWGLERDTRRAVGLPEEFDRELFNAVDVVVRGQVERASLYPETVLEDADADPLGVIAPPPPPVLKKQSHQLTSQKRQIEVINKAERKNVDDREAGSAEAMATQLREKAEMIQAILEGKLGVDNNNLRQQGAACGINVARRQGDKLIDCFSVIAATLDQLCNVAQIQ